MTMTMTTIEMICAEYESRQEGKSSLSDVFLVTENDGVLAYSAIATRENTRGDMIWRTHVDITATVKVDDDGKSRITEIDFKHWNA